MKKIFSIIIVVLILSVFVFALTKDELTNARTCDASGITEIFDKYSDSGQTGYILTPKGDVLQFVCKDGKWIPTLEYAEINKIDIEKIELSSELVASAKDEVGRDIIYSSVPNIIVDSSKEIVIGDKIYNVTYVPIIKERIKCICEKLCKIEECLQ